MGLELEATSIQAWDPHPGATVDPAGDTLTQTLSPVEGSTSREDGTVLERGSRLGRYVLLRLLGCGGHGTVYDAYDPELDRHVALKLVADPRGGDPGFARGWLRSEGQAIARLTHPNVVRVYDLGEAGAGFFLAMERIEGPTLSGWLADRPRSWREVVRLLCGAGRGLAAAHAVGLVHRDVKPGNILIAPGDRAVVLDFGLARAIADDAGAPSHHEAAASAAGDPTTFRGWGTPAYMAPEQRLGRPVDARADQYSFCRVLCEALDRQVPARAGGAPGDSPPLLPAPGRRAPSRLRRLLDRGLALHPDDRFAGLLELVEALEEIASPRRARWVALAAGVGAVALGLGLSRAWIEPALRCSAPARSLEEIWNSRRSAELQRTFAGAGPIVEASFGGIAQSLDAWSQRWTAARQDACEATHRHGEQSPQLLDLRMGCFDGLLHELRAALELLAAGDPKTLASAGRIVGRLSGTGLCAEVPRLLSAPAPPADPELAQRVQAVRLELARSKALEGAGRYRESLEGTRQALATASQLGYPPIEVQARLRFAVAHGRIGEFGEMRRQLVETARQGQAHRVDEEVAGAFTFLILAAVLQRQPDAARDYDQLAAGALERLGDSGRLEALRQLFLGELATLEGRFEDALAHHESYLRIYPDLGPGERGYGRLNMGQLHLRLGRRPEAEREFLAAREELARGYGETSRAVAAAHQCLGDVARVAGGWQAAEGQYRRAVGIYAVIGDPDDPESAPSLAGLGEALLRLGRPAEAQPYLERAARTWRETGADPEGLARSEAQLAQVRRTLGRRLAP
ncbi:MAG TPA: serine/threonine-protein kinase [Thermoanaerobaculia bacterium]|nr:serine/threonine-protein kinase [Thermoanaerobaculia bacterium]